MRSSLVEAASAVREGSVSPVDLVRHALGQAEAHAGLNSLAHLDAEGALAAAAELTREARSGRLRGPLHGIPVTVKDLFAVSGMPTRGGTRGPLPPFDVAEAPAVGRLRRAGAIVLAMTNMHEIGMGISGENPVTGDVENPHDPARQAGGSSGGSAAAVAVGIGFASLGSDSGGSIRIPAALCGVVGFKPTYGAVPADGALMFGSTHGHAGPLTRSAADARVVYEVLADVHGRRPAGLPGRPRLGVPRRYLDGALGPEVRSAFEQLLDRLRALGARPEDVEPPHLESALDAFTPVSRAEAAHGFRAMTTADLEAFSPPVRAALEQGRALSATAYLEARRLRRLVRAGLDETLGRVDALLLPTTPVPAPLRGTAQVSLESGDVPQRTAFLRLTVPFNITGLPALSVPFARAGGVLPLGVQIVTARGRDLEALDLGTWLEAHLALCAW